MDRNFRLARCCFTCNFRKREKETIRSILCTLDGERRNGILVCSEYKKSRDRYVIAGQSKILKSIKEAKS